MLGGLELARLPSGGSRLHQLILWTSRWRAHRRASTLPLLPSDAWVTR